MAGSTIEKFKETKPVNEIILDPCDSVFEGIGCNLDSGHALSGRCNHVGVTADRILRWADGVGITRDEEICKYYCAHCNGGYNDANYRRKNAPPRLGTVFCCDDCYQAHSAKVFKEKLQKSA